ncbi:MotA/TolQ/ExbB proton channel family protein, partial [Vibrio parahaemolyticus]|nr:MotA/TolQ/ExbB proton channel family protein [Vibrio parahaemolyticus]
MKGFKTLAAGLLASLFMVSGVQAETPQTLSELLKNVKSESIVESKENKEREAVF